MSAAPSSFELDRTGGLWRGRFRAMASPCELLIDGGDEHDAHRLVRLVADEAWRVETTYSRYRDDSVVQRINSANGHAIDVDDETAHLLDFAAHCHAISDGAFDVTAGVLRELWRFDGGHRVPARADVAALLPRIGWDRVDWRRPTLRLPADMQIDFGGIGKEYAVDRALMLARAASDRPMLVNFGGDLAASAPPASGAWHVGIEAPDDGGRATRTISLERGALATSGDARRYLLRDGVRYGHVLDARTGWPPVNAPRSVTVAADTCTEAGVLATLGVLAGADAERLLAGEARGWWCDRENLSRD